MIIITIIIIVFKFKLCFTLLVKMLVYSFPTASKRIDSYINHARYFTASMWWNNLTEWKV